MNDSGLLDDIPAPLWKRVARARKRVLMLDYDGTLAPFTPRRDQSRPIPESIERIRCLARSDHTRIAIVSGRPLAELEALIGPLAATLVGEHGWDWRAPAGAIVRHPLDDDARQALSDAARLAIEAGLGEQLERKRAAVLVHTRGLPRAREVGERAVALWRSFGEGSSFTLDRLDGGIELRARDHNKGTAARMLLEEAGPEALGVFVGDDVTDEDAFEALREPGFGIRVGDERRSSLARGRLPSPAAVPTFLKEWQRLTDGRADAS